MAVRVAHVIPTVRIAYLMLRVRLAKLRDAGYEVTVICGRGPRAELEWRSFSEELRSMGLEVTQIPFAREISPLTDMRCTAALYRVIHRGRFDIVHSHNPKGGLLSPVAARLSRSTLVLHTVHGFLFNENTAGLRHLAALSAERWTAAFCHHLLFQSEEDYDYAIRHRFKEESRLHLIGNGIDETRFDPARYPGAGRRTRSALGWGEGDLVVGMVGRTVLEKGYAEFFEMAARLARRLPTVRFLVVAISEPDQTDAVDPHRLIAENGLDGRCRVLEQRSDMPELYLAMDVAVLPSHREGIPRALMEAAAMGVPLVASDIRGCREVIEDGSSGRLFPLKDVDGLEAAVGELLADHTARRAMGQAAKARVLANYTESGTAQRLVTCYEEVLEDRRRRGPRTMSRQAC